MTRRRYWSRCSTVTDLSDHPEEGGHRRPEPIRAVGDEAVGGSLGTLMMTPEIQQEP